MVVGSVDDEVATDDVDVEVVDVANGACDVDRRIALEGEE